MSEPVMWCKKCGDVSFWREWPHNGCPDTPPGTPIDLVRVYELAKALCYSQDALTPFVLGKLRAALGEET